MACGRGERPVREMGFQTRDAVRSDDCVVRGAGHELEAVALGEVDGSGGEPEPDAASGDDDDLVVAVVVRRVPIARAVGPRAGLETLSGEARAERAGVGHGRGMVPADGAGHTLLVGRRAPSKRSVPSPRLASMQEPVLYLSADDVKAAMPPVAERLELAERTMTALVADAELPPKIAVHPRPPGSFAHAMPAALRPAGVPDGSGDLLGIKWVTGFPENRAKGLPAIHAVVVLTDAQTGVPRAMLDGGPITAQRTAAVSGVAIERFGPTAAAIAGAADHPPRATLIGAGVQGDSHLEVLGYTLPGVRLTIVDRHPDRAERLADTARRTVGIAGAEAVGPEAMREATRAADIVVTAASFTDPRNRQVMDASWLGPDALVVPVDYATMLAASVARDAALFLVDDRGQFLVNRDTGQFDDYPDPTATLGEAILDGTIRPATGRVVVTHLGVGLADVVFADAIVRRAVSAGLGIALPR